MSSQKPAEPDDDDWTLRTSSLGADVAEVTLTLCAAARRRQAASLLALAAAAALLISLLPLPPLAAAAAAAAPPLLQRSAALRQLLLLLQPLLHGGAGGGAGGGGDGGASLLAAALEACARLALLCVALAALPQPVVQESVVALRGLGVQLRTVRRGGGASVRFVDASRLRALVVNEGIQRCTVRYYLALVVAGRASLLLLFDHARPRLPAVGDIYRSLFAALFPELASDAAERYLDAIGGEER